MDGEVWGRGWAEEQAPQPSPPAGKSTLAIVTFARYEWFEEWKDKQVHKRGDDYEDLKKTFVDAIMQTVLKLYPRIEGRVRKHRGRGSSSSSLGHLYLPSDHGVVGWFGLEKTLMLIQF